MISPGRARDHTPAYPGRPDPCSSHVRQEIVALTEHGVLQRALQLFKDREEMAKPRLRHDDLGPLAAATTEAIFAAARTGRLPRRAELRIFRVLGVRYAAAGYLEYELTEMLDNYAECLRDLMVWTSPALDGKHGRREVNRAVASLCGIVEVVAKRAYDEIMQGGAYLALDESSGAERLWWQRLLSHDDAPLPDAPPLPLGGRHVAVVLSGSGGMPDAPAFSWGRCASPLEAAAREISCLLPATVDVGRADDPSHWRLVLREQSRATRRDASAYVGLVAASYGLRAMTSHPVVCPDRLRTVYRRLVARLCSDLSHEPDGQDATPSAEPPLGVASTAEPTTNRAGSDAVDGSAPGAVNASHSVFPKQRSSLPT